MQFYFKYLRQSNRIAIRIRPNPTRPDPKPETTVTKAYSNQSQKWASDPSYDSIRVQYDNAIRLLYLPTSDCNNERTCTQETSRPYIHYICDSNTFLYYGMKILENCFACNVNSIVLEIKNYIKHQRHYIYIFILCACCIMCYINQTTEC